MSANYDYTGDAPSGSLWTTPIEKIIPPNQNLITVSAKEPVATAFRTLAQNNIYSAPVVDNETGECFGFVDMLDIVTFIVEIYERQHKKEPTGKRKSLSAFEDFYSLLSQVEKFDLEQTSCIVDLSKRNPMVPIKHDATLLECLELFAKNKVHRMPIMEGKKIINVITQSGIVNWLSKHKSLLGASLCKKTLNDLQLGFKPLISVKMTDMTWDAFQTIVKHGVSAVGVLDNEGCLFSNLSAKDIRLIACDALFTKLYKSVLEYIQSVRALEVKAKSPSFAVHPGHTFGDVIERLAVLRVHRIYLTDIKTFRPLGVISLGDVLEKVLNEYNYSSGIKLNSS